MSRFKGDGTLKFIGDQFEFGACPNPECKKFNKPFMSRRSAVGHFAQPCKSECARIHSMMERANVSAEKKVAARIPKRLKVNMPDEAQFCGAPPIFSRKFTSVAYRPLYTQTSSRVPDPSIPLVQTITTDTQVQVNNDTNSGGDSGQVASNPPIKDNGVRTTDASDNVFGNSPSTLPVLSERQTVGLDQEANQDRKVSGAIGPSKPEAYRSPFLSESGNPYNSRSHFQDSSRQSLHSFPVELVLVAELIMMLDSMGATKTALEKVLKWHSKAVLRNANFFNIPVTRDANMAAIRKSLPKHMVDSYLPYVKPVRMLGFNEDTNVVGFDIVPQILSLLQSPSHMREENLVLNPANHFDNYYHAMAGPKNAGKKINCARAGSVYQEYVRRKGPDFNEFVFDLIIGFDSVNVTKNGRTSSCPVLISSSLFKEEFRRKPEFWRVIGYIVDPTEKSKSENTTNEKGHSTRNMHSQLEVILDGLKRLHSGQDSRLNSVQITIGKQTKKGLRVDTPVLFFILDGKERESVTVKVKGTNKSTRRHSSPCDVAPYTNLSDSSHNCKIMKASTVEYYVDTSDEVALHNISQHNIKSAFRGIRFCDGDHGVFGGITTDSLHCMLLCFFKRALSCFFEKLSAREKEVLDRMARRYNKSQRSCCRDEFPRTSFVKGITNLDRKEGKEYRGMIFVLCILIHDMTAWELLDKACKRRGRDLTGILNTFEMMLCLDAWTKGKEYWTPRDSSVEEARVREAIGVVIESVKTHLPREEGNNWNLPNVHALFHYPRDITRFGPPDEYTTWFMESGHKHHVKVPGRTVAKVKGRFDHGLALSVRSQYELKMFMDCANAHCEVVDLMTDEDSEEEEDVSGVDVRLDDSEGDEGGCDGSKESEDEGSNNEDNGGLDDSVFLDEITEGATGVSVFEFIKSTPQMKQMLKYSTRYIVRSSLGQGGSVTVNVDWLTRSYHKHSIKFGVVGRLVAEHGAMEYGVERRIYGFTKCRIGKWLIHCHPNERGKGPWYDWVMIKRRRHDTVVYDPARVASFFINEDDKDRKLQAIVQFSGPKIPETSSVLFDIYEFNADDHANGGGGSGILRMC